LIITIGQQCSAGFKIGASIQALHIAALCLYDWQAWQLQHHGHGEVSMSWAFSALLTERFGHWP
jgi:hypothetical protein